MSNQEIEYSEHLPLVAQMKQKYPGLKQHKDIDVAKVFEYVRGPDAIEMMSKVLAETKVKVTFIDYDRYFPEDTDERNIYRITVTRNGKSTSFKYGSSLQDTHTGTKPDLYDVFNVIGSEYSSGMIESFEDFCEEFGYDVDSRKAEKTYKALRQQYKKLSRLFYEDETYWFPG